MHGSLVLRLYHQFGRSDFSSPGIATRQRLAFARSPHKLRADHIPCDAMYLDIDFQEQNRPFTVDLAEDFPHFPGMIQNSAKATLSLVAITDLHIAHLPNRNYAPYESGMAGDNFVKNPDGQSSRDGLAGTFGLSRLHAAKHPRMVGSLYETVSKRALPASGTT